MAFEREIQAGQVVEGMNFHQRVWAVTARVPRGRVVTYGDLAKAVGGPTFRGYRAVGHAMNRNPYAPQVPCHRVVGSDGRLTGFASGLEAKRQLLESEGVTIVSDRVDLKRHRCALDEE